MLKQLIARELRRIADNIDAGSSEITEEQAMVIFNGFTHEPLSKEQACRYLNMSRSTFDTRVRLGFLPKGRKRSGWKELIWYKDELDPIQQNK